MMDGAWEPWEGWGSADGPAVPPSACAGGSQEAPLGLRGQDGKPCG